MAEQLVSWLLTTDKHDDHVSDGEVEEDNQQAAADFKEWLKDAKEVLDDVSYKHDRGILGDKLHHHYALPQLLNLRECLLNHRWSDALRVMVEVVKHPFYTSQAIFRVGLELFYQLTDGDSSAHGHFLKELKQIGELNGREVCTEQGLHLLVDHKQDQALSAFVEPRLLRQPSSLPLRTCQVNLLFKVYLGLAFYAEWLIAKQQITREKEGADGESAAYSQDTLIMMESMTPMAEKVIQCFQPLQGERGVWDVFVTKYVEVLEFVNKLSEATEVVEDYAAKNPLNPNAHRYLYEYYTRHEFSSQDRVNALGKLVDLAPADDLVLDLHSLLLEQDSPVSDSLPLLFNLLDYSQWQQQPRPWKRLASQLVQIYSRSDKADLKVVDLCWTYRCDWWLPYQFAVPADTQRSKVMAYKAAVAACLCGQDNSYTQHVLQTKSKRHELLQKALELTSHSNPG